MRLFGTRARDFLDRYLELVTIGLGLLLVGGFLVVGWLAK
jgi:hypothetical protein